MCAVVAVDFSADRKDKVNHNGGHVPVNMRRKLLSSSLEEVNPKPSSVVSSSLSALISKPLPSIPMVGEPNAELINLQEARKDGVFNPDRVKKTTQTTSKKKRKVKVKVKKDEAFVEPVQEQPELEPVKDVAPPKKKKVKTQPKPKAKSKQTQSFKPDEAIAKDFVRRILAGEVTEARQFLRDCSGVDAKSNTYVEAMHAEANMAAFVQEHIELIKSAFSDDEVELLPTKPFASDDGPAVTFKVSVKKPNPAYIEGKVQHGVRKYIKSTGNVTRPNRYLTWFKDNTPVADKNGKPLVADLSAAPIKSGMHTEMVVVRDYVPVMVGGNVIGRNVITSMIKVPVDPIAHSYGLVHYDWRSLRMEGLKKTWNSAASRQEKDVMVHVPESLKAPWSEEKAKVVEPFLTPEMYYTMRNSYVKQCVEEVDKLPFFTEDVYLQRRLERVGESIEESDRLYNAGIIGFNDAPVLASTTQPAADKQDEPRNIVIECDDEQAAALEQFAKALNPDREVVTTTLKGMVRKLRPKSGAMIVYEIEQRKREEERARYQQWYMARPDLMRQWEREQKWMMSFDTSEQARLDNWLANHESPYGWDEWRYSLYWDNLRDAPSAVATSLFKLEQQVHFNPVRCDTPEQVHTKQLLKAEKIAQRVKDPYKLGITPPKRQVTEVSGESMKPDKPTLVLAPDFNPEQYVVDEIMRARPPTPSGESLTTVLKNKVVNLDLVKFLKSFKQTDSGIFVPPDTA